MPSESSNSPRVALFGKVRRLAERWRTSVIAVAGLVICEVGSRVGVPGADGRIVREFFRGNPGGLLAIYDRLVGGAVSRAAVLALGVMPYFSARCFVWIARSAIPAVKTLAADAAGQAKLTRWTRGLTVGLALAQSYGFARFVQSIPGAVLHPGAEFIGQTMLLLTSGAVVVTLLVDQITTPPDDDPPTEGDIERTEGRGTSVRLDDGRARVLGRDATEGLLLGQGELLEVTIGQRQGAERARVIVPLGAQGDAAAPGLSRPGIPPMNGGGRRDFFFDGKVVGYFASDASPGAAGRYRYIPYRGTGHYTMGQAVSRGDVARCWFTDGEAVLEFVVRGLPEVHVIDIGPVAPRAAESAQ